MWCVIFTDVDSNGKEYKKVYGHFPSKSDAYQWARAHDGHKRMDFAQLTMVDLSYVGPSWIKP